MISDIATFTALKERMRFFQKRQSVLAENIANSDTPRFRPRDLAEPTAGSGMQEAFSLAVTQPGHMGAQASSGPGFQKGSTFETRPSGNAVDLEGEMLKMSNNQIAFQTAANLYQRGLGSIKLALGKRA